MSCSWDLYCKDCKEYANYDLNHGDGELRALVKLAPAIKAFIDQCAQIPENILEVNVLFHYDQKSPDWVVRHFQHHLQLFDEYGREASLEIAGKEEESDL